MELKKKIGKAFFMLHLVQIVQKCQENVLKFMSYMVDSFELAGL